MEEDIKILEGFLDLARTRNYKGDLTGSFDEFELEVEEKEYKALENLIAGYKQLEEENKSKQKAYDDCYCEYKHYKQFDSIPKSKVKEKIEEIEKLKDVPHELDFKAYYRVKDLRNIKIGILQQLLEDFEETGNHIPIID